MFTIGNYEINKPIIDILYDLQRAQKDKLQFFYDRGDEIQVQCPCHAEGHEKRGSCFINKETSVWHCFTCGESGRFPRFVSKVLNKSIDFSEKWLLENCDYTYVDSPVSLEEINLNKENKDVNVYIDDSILDSFESYHPYMTQRHLNSDVLKRFEVKYDPETKSIVFPVRDVKGRLVGLTRRSVEGKKFDINKGFDKKNIYLLYEAIKYKQVVVVESQINALTSWQYGVPSIALFGAGTPIDQLNVLKDTSISHFILMYDNDDAGRKGANKFKSFMKNKFVTDIIMPKGKDVNDLTKEEFYSILDKNLVYLDKNV